MINVQHVSKHFKHINAVQDVSLSVNKGDIMGLVGPDGAGKTTLLRMICGLITPDAGNILLMGKSIDDLDEARNNLGYMPQRFSLYGDLTVEENIHFFGSMYKLDRTLINQRADEILHITKLKPFKNRFADQLSGGMKQKLALTCALITRPGILVLDEPTYGVDPESRKEFWKILYQLNKEGMTILLSTPYMDEAELCTQVAFISEGVLRAVNAPAALKKSFSYPVLQITLKAKQRLALEDLPGVLDVSYLGTKIHVVIDHHQETVETIRQSLLQQQVSGFSIQEIRPSMEDIFVALAEGGLKRWDLQ
ncbi:MAG: ABC transporter ATP-binding protein [Bacillota bacterium]|nr:ABC transporter ATP-binding protein [Bacillota bacterium]